MDEVEYRDEHYCYRFGEVNHAPYRFPADDTAGMPQVSIYYYHIRGSRENGISVSYHHRIIIDIDRPRVRPDRPRDLVRVLSGRQAAAYVYELMDTSLASQIPHRTAQEITVFTASHFHVGQHAAQFLGRIPVSSEVIFPAKEVIVNAGNVRDGSIKVGHRHHSQRLCTAGSARVAGQCRRHRSS